MDSRPNQGWANFLAFRAESSLAGSLTGSLLGAAGKVRFSYEPVLSGGKQTLNIWRQPGRDSFANRYWQGMFEFELSPNSLAALLLPCCLELRSTASGGGHTTYTFGLPTLGTIASCRAFLEYKPDGNNYEFRGMVFDSMRLAVRFPETVHIQLGWKAVEQVEYGSPLYGTQTNPTTAARTHLDGILALDGVSQANVTEFTFAAQCAKAPGRFASGKPGLFSHKGAGLFSGEVAHYLNSMAIAEAVRNLESKELAISISSGASSLSAAIPTAKFRAGTPGGIEPGDIVPRGTWEHISGDDNEDEPTLTLVV